MDFDPEIVEKNFQINPANLLPYSKRWEKEVPMEDRLPSAFRGGMSHSMLDAQPV